MERTNTWAICVAVIKLILECAIYITTERKFYRQISVCDNVKSVGSGEVVEVYGKPHEEEQTLQRARMSILSKDNQKAQAGHVGLNSI